MSSLQSYSFTEKQLAVLQKNIEIHNKNHVFLYPKPTDSAGKAITPKLHSLIHFPSQIKQFGPPRFSWCFRYESKNAPFKKIMRRNSNFHNVPWTLASHHQKLVGMDIRIDGEGHYFGKFEDYSVNESHTPFAVKYARWCNILCDATPLGENSKIQSIKKITMAGRKCKIGTVFLRQLPNHCKQKVFFGIADAIISDHGIYFIMEEMETRLFCLDRFSFIAVSQKTFCVVERHALSFDAPLHSFEYESELHVVPNYYHML